MKYSQRFCWIWVYCNSRIKIWKRNCWVQSLQVITILSLNQRFSTGSGSASLGDIWPGVESFSFSWPGVEESTGIKWFKARGAAKLHARHFLTTKIYLSLNNAEVEKPCCKLVELEMNELLETVLWDLRGQRRDMQVSLQEVQGHHRAALQMMI